MLRLTSTQARKRFSSILDAAESGQAVVIERRGVRFRLQAEPAPAPREARRESIFEFVDPAVEAGSWSWEWADDGVRFAVRDPEQR